MMNRSKRGSWVGKAALGVGIYLGGRQIVREMRRFDLRGKLVLITGGSRGLGLLLAREYLAAGSRVAICARNADELESARLQLASNGNEVWTGVCDITSDESVRDFCRKLTSEGGPVDVLVNNAGTIGVGPLDSMTTDDYRLALETNFWGAYRMTSELVDGMRSRGGGRIVNVSSIGGKMAIPHLLPYSASKFALGGWSAGLRAELQRENIYVSSIFPGLMRTGSPRNALFKGQHRKEYAWFAIGDALPITSMDASRAARRIVQASIYGQAEVVLSWQAKLASLVTALAPGLTAELAAIANRCLPTAGGIGTETKKGYESESFAAPSVLTALSDRAAAQNNQFGR